VRMQVAATEGSGDNLSVREREVVRLLAEGRSFREMARMLEISESTVRGDIRNILAKLGLHNGSQVVAWYRNAPEA
jgi:DNA-binding CsgD family transcriptional regulator